MRSRMKGQALRVALVTVAVPAAAWALEQAARRAETRDKTSPTSRRLRQGADFVQHLGRGPLADRLGRRPATTVIREDREPQRTDQHGG
jgi:hypothetical protein